MASAYFRRSWYLCRRTLGSRSLSTQRGPWYGPSPPRPQAACRRRSVAQPTLLPERLPVRFQSSWCSSDFSACSGDMQRRSCNPRLKTTPVRPMRVPRWPTSQEWSGSIERVQCQDGIGRQPLRFACVNRGHEAVPGCVLCAWCRCALGYSGLGRPVPQGEDHHPHSLPESCRMR